MKRISLAIAIAFGGTFVCRGDVICSPFQFGLAGAGASEASDLWLERAGNLGMHRRAPERNFVARDRSVGGCRRQYSLVDGPDRQVNFVNGT